MTHAVWHPVRAQVHLCRKSRYALRLGLSEHWYYLSVNCPMPILKFDARQLFWGCFVDNKIALFGLLHILVPKRIYDGRRACTSACYLLDKGSLFLSLLANQVGNKGGCKSFAVGSNREGCFWCDLHLMSNVSLTKSHFKDGFLGICHRQRQTWNLQALHHAIDELLDFTYCLLRFRKSSAFPAQNIAVQARTSSNEPLSTISTASFLGIGNEPCVCPP